MAKASCSMLASYLTRIKLLPEPFGREESAWEVWWVGSRVAAMTVLVGWGLAIGRLWVELGVHGGELTWFGWAR